MLLGVLRVFHFELSTNGSYSGGPRFASWLGDKYCPSRQMPGKLNDFQFVIHSLITLPSELQKRRLISSDVVHWLRLTRVREVHLVHIVLCCSGSDVRELLGCQVGHQSAGRVHVRQAAGPLHHHRDRTGAALLW